MINISRGKLEGVSVFMSQLLHSLEFDTMQILYYFSCAKLSTLNHTRD